MSEITAIIPARGGSKGIPRKNIRELNGMPLIAYTIEAAKMIPGIGRIIVSTDDREIAGIAIDFGAEVPFLRPVELAGDSSEISSALTYTREELARREGFTLSYEITLYPTHPFRNRSLMKKLSGLLLKGHRHVITAVEKRPSALGYFYPANSGGLKPLLDSGTHPGKRIYARKTGWFIGNNYLYPELPPYVHVIEDPITAIDIDYMDDLLLAEEILRKGLFDFES